MRELTKEPGLTDISVGGSCTPSASPGRDPRGWVVSVVHLALLRMAERVPAAGDDARRAEWVPVKRAKLAFDHGVALERALARIRARAERFPFVPEALLPEKFTLRELEASAGRCSASRSTNATSGSAP